MSTNGIHTYDADTAEPLSPYDITPFNDALAVAQKVANDAGRDAKMWRWVGIPVFGIALCVAIFNASKPVQDYVHTITIYCYINTAVHHLHPHGATPVCDSTQTDISDLIPIQKDAAAQNIIAKNLLPIIIRKAFEISTAETTTNDVHDLVVPYLDEKSNAYTFFMDYYKKNDVAKLSATQTTTVSVDPIQDAQTPGNYLIGYTVTSSNGVTSTSNHFLAEVKVEFKAAAGANTSGLYIYGFAIDNTQPGAQQ